MREHSNKVRWPLHDAVDLCKDLTLPNSEQFFLIFTG